MTRVSRIAASFSGDCAATRMVRLHESGQLRLRRLRGEPCEAVVVNTAGGIVGGDRLALAIDVTSAGAAVTIGSAAAEKCYRSTKTASELGVRLGVGEGACLHWLPQETILFDGARLHRFFEVELAPTASFLAVETTIFGRLASGETMTQGGYRDSWRLRRAGRLVYAEETRLDAPIATVLDRSAVGGGARAVATIILAADHVEALLEPLRAALERLPGSDAAVHAGASVRGGVLLARLLSRAPERLRECIAAALAVLRGGAPPPKLDLGFEAYVQATWPLPCCRSEAGFSGKGCQHVPGGRSDLP